MPPRRSMARKDSEKFDFKPQNPKTFGTSEASSGAFSRQPVWLSGVSNTILANSFIDGALAKTPETDLQYFNTQPTSFSGSIARDVEPFDKDRKFRDRVLKESIVKPSETSAKQKEYETFIDLGKSAWRKGIKNHLSVIASQKQTSVDQVRKFIEKDYRFSLLDGLAQGIREGFGLPKPTKYTQAQCEQLYTRVLGLDPTLLTASWDTMYQILECLSVFQLFQKRYIETMQGITKFVKAELIKRGKAFGAYVGSAVTSFLANVANRNLMGDMREAFDWFIAMAKRLIDACRIFDLPRPEFDLELRMGEADADDEEILTAPTQPPAPPPPPGSSATGLRQDVPNAQAQTSDSNLGTGGTGGGPGQPPPPGPGPPPQNAPAPPGTAPPIQAGTASPPVVPDTNGIDSGVVKSSYSSYLLFAINSVLVPLTILNTMKGIYNAVSAPSIPRDIEEASEQALVRSRGRIESIPALLAMISPNRFWTSNLVLLVLESNPGQNWLHVSTILSNWFAYLVNTEIVNEGARSPLLQGVDITEVSIENQEFALTDFLRQEIPADVRASLQRAIDELRRQRGGGGSSSSTVAESSSQGAERANRDETRVEVSAELTQSIQQLQELVRNFPRTGSVISRRDPGIVLARAFATTVQANRGKFMANGVNLLDLARQIYPLIRFLLNNFYIGNTVRARSNRELLSLPETLPERITQRDVEQFSRVAESTSMLDSIVSSPAIAGFRQYLSQLNSIMDDYISNQAEASGSMPNVGGGMNRP